MLLVLSPAKSLNLEKPIDCAFASQPLFHTANKPIIQVLKKMKQKQIQEVFALSENLAQLNYHRFQSLGSKENIAQSRQAMFTFDGEVYLGFDTYSLDKKKFQYAQDNIRILSGLYGVLKPFDLIEPYRLEMGTKISIGSAKNLYAFWMEKVTEAINSDLISSSHLLNLASQEYFKVIDTKKLAKPIIHFEFLESDKGEFKNISFFSKKARGLVARYIVDNKIKKYTDIQSFDSERYTYHPTLSNPNKFVFTRKFLPIGKK